MHHVTYLGWITLGANIILKVIFKVRKVKVGPLLSNFANISDTVHVMTNVSMKHIYLSNVIRSSQGHRTFKEGVYLINGASYMSYDQSLYEIHIASHIMASLHFTFDEIEGQIKVIEAIFHKPSTVYDQSC